MSPACPFLPTHFGQTPAPRSRISNSTPLVLQTDGITEILKAPGKLADKIQGISGTRNLGDNLSDLKAQVMDNVKADDPLQVPTVMLEQLFGLHNTPLLEAQAFAFGEQLVAVVWQSLKLRAVVR